MEYLHKQRIGFFSEEIKLINEKTKCAFGFADQVQEIDELAVSGDFGLNDDEALAIYNIVFKEKSVLQKVAGNTAFPDIIIKDTLKRHQELYEAEAKALTFKLRSTIT